MTKQGATNAMLNGAKVTHPYFLDDEYIFMESGIIYFEDGKIATDFWERRSSYGWARDWTIYRD